MLLQKGSVHLIPDLYKDTANLDEDSASISLPCLDYVQNEHVDARLTTLALDSKPNAVFAIPSLFHPRFSFIKFKLFVPFYENTKVFLHICVSHTCSAFRRPSLVRLI
jgi:hypothetical protein